MMGRARWRSLVACALLLACGPTAPAESESDSGSSGGGSSSSGAPTPDDTGDPPTGGGPTTATPTTDDPTTDEPTTDEPTSGDPTGGDTPPPPPTCTGGGASFTTLWTMKSTEPGEVPNLGLTRGIARTMDGRLVMGAGALVGDGQFKTGLMMAGPSGEPSELELHLGEVTAAIGLATMAVAVESTGHPVLVGTLRREAGDRGWISRHDASGAELGRAELDSEHLLFPVEVVATNRTFILGFDPATLEIWVGEFDSTTGARAWETRLEAATGAPAMFLARGPTGELVAARGGWADAPADVKVWGLSLTGEIAWSSSLGADEPSSGRLGGLVVTPDKQVIVLENFFGAPARVVAVSLDLSDGALRWTNEVATTDADGDPRSGGALVNGEQIAVVIVRAPDLGDGDEGDPLSATVHSLTATGEPAAIVPLSLPSLDAGAAELVPLRGVCGDMVLFHPDDDSWWLGSLAP